MSDTGLIEAASGQCRTMADGTLRIWFDIEPRHAADAFRLFSAPGTPAVLGRLQVPAPSPAPAPPAQPRERMGPLCELAVKLCRDPMFQRWSYMQPRTLMASLDGLTREDQAKALILAACGIESRKQLDADDRVRNAFHDRVRRPYMRWLAEQGVTA